MTERKIETGTDHLLARVTDGVAVLTMNRPEARNALSDAMVSALGATLREAETAADVRCVVLTGAGGAFCAGGDVKRMASRGGPVEGVKTASAGAGIDAAIHLQRLAQRETAGRIYGMPKPVIAALPGPAAGAGFALALSCDLRIASERAVLVTAFARVGYSGDFGASYLLPHLVGPARAKELFFLSPRIDARKAEELGLVNRVVAPEELESETMELALRLAAGPSIAYRYMKENINRAYTASFEECLDLESTHQNHTGQTEDHREATRAFVEKREPTFKGR